MKSLYLAALALATSLAPVAVHAAASTVQVDTSVSTFENAQSYDRRGNHRGGGYWQRGGYGGEHRGRAYNHRGNYNEWNRGWHNNRRYDWRSHRNYNRNYYRPVRYYAPYRDHRYNRVNIGFYLGNGFYGQRYWVNNPSYYRLPAAYGPYRWVR